MSDDGTAVTLWRCEGCGKWSHAKRQPKRHQRNLYTEDEPDPAIVVTPMAEMEHDTGAWSTVGWVVWCGPFTEWRARRMTPTSGRAPVAAEPGRDSNDLPK